MSFKDDLDRHDREFRDVWEAIKEIRVELQTRIPLWASLKLSALSWLVGILMTLLLVLIKQVLS